jgi:ADP-ribose pyrophosphatase
VRVGRVTDVKTVIGIFWAERVLAGAWTPGRPA